MGEQIFGTPNWGRINCDDGHTQELVNSLQAERERMNTRVAELESQLAAAEATALEKGNEWAQAIQHATVFRERWQAAEAKLAAIPIESLVYCFRTEIEDREDDDWAGHTNNVHDWLDTIAPPTRP